MSSSCSGLRIAGSPFDSPVVTRSSGWAGGAVTECVRS
jgi:hypothetical protein